MSKRKSWQETLADDKGFPKVFPIGASKSKWWGEGTFVIPAPREVDAIMRAVPKGKRFFVREYSNSLALTRVQAPRRSPRSKIVPLDLSSQSSPRFPSRTP